MKEFDFLVQIAGLYKDPKLVAYRRFAESKGINPDDYNAAAKAFFDEAWRRFQKKEQAWLRGARRE